MREVARQVWIFAGTKGGKTRAAAVWLVMRALNGGPGLYWWVGPWNKTTKAGFRELKRIVRPLARRKLCTVIEGLKRIEFPDGAIIECHTGEKPDSLMGQGVKAAVVDEASRCRPELYKVMRSVTTATKGPIRWLSNADRGRRHWAIKQLLAAQQRSTIKDADGLGGRSPDGKVAYYHFPTSANPYIDPEEIADAKATLPERIFRALYLAEIQEDGAGVFAEADIDAAQVLKYVRGADGRPRLDKNGRYVMGVDLARKQDYTVAIIVDRRTNQVADWLRFNKKEWTSQVQQVADLAKRWSASAVVEANGVGDPIVELLSKQGVSVIPFITDNLSKSQIIAQLMLVFEQRKLFIPTEEEFPELGEELANYEYKYSKRGNLQYSAPEGFHDDTVIALALAEWAVANAPGPFMYSPVGREGQQEGEMSMDEQWRKGM